MNERHSLTTQTREKIQGVLASFPQVEKAVIYGSRAQGNFKPGSDIDLTLFGDGLTDAMMSRIYWALDDLLLPYKIDLSLFSGLKHTALIDHIRRVGIVLYTREPAAAEPSLALRPIRAAPPSTILCPPSSNPPPSRRSSHVTRHFLPYSSPPISSKTRADASSTAPVAAVYDRRRSFLDCRNRPFDHINLCLDQTDSVFDRDNRLLEPLNSIENTCRRLFDTASRPF